MPTFIFQARDNSGALASGQMVADSLTAAIQSLRAEGKYPTSVTPADEMQAAQKSLGFTIGAPRLNRKDLLQFVTQLQIMIETGVTLTEALDSIATQAHKPSMQKVIGDVGRNVQGGDSLSLAFSRQKRSFPRLLVALVAASEKSGLMARLLGRANVYLKDECDTIRRVRGALTYPAIMLAFAIGTTCFLMTCVLPKFTAIYASKGAALPMLTQVLMDISAFMVNDWLFILIGLAVLTIGTWQYLRTESGWRLFDYLPLNFPLLGPVFLKLHLARGIRLIGTMAGSGINLPECVTTAEDLCDNSYFRDLWHTVSQQIQTGRQLSEPLFQSALVPKSIAQMLHSAEKGGRLAAVMEQISGYLEEELKEQIVNMTRYIEPLMITVMGGVIGTVALALMLPIFTISKVIVK
jgi:type IV pilus assembly protein PilC